MLVSSSDAKGSTPATAGSIAVPRRVAAALALGCAASTTPLLLRHAGYVKCAVHEATCTEQFQEERQAVERVGSPYSRTAESGFSGVSRALDFPFSVGVTQIAYQQIAALPGQIGRADAYP